MKIYDDILDLYGPDGKILEESVPLESISPLKNSAIQEMIYDIKRSCAVNLAGIENGLKNAAMGGKATYIPGRELDYEIVENADVIADKIKKILRVNEDDDTTVELINDGQQLLVQLPFERLNVAADYSVSTMQTGAATIQAIIDSFEVNMFDASTIKTAVMGAYPQTLDLSGANISPDVLTFWDNLITKTFYFFTRSKYIKMMLNEPNIPLSDLQKIVIPVHVIAGEKDVIKYEHTKLIADNIKNSTLEIVKGEKHGSYIIHSDKIYEIIRNYVTKT